MNSCLSTDLIADGLLAKQVDVLVENVPVRFHLTCQPLMTTISLIQSITTPFSNRGVRGQGCIHNLRDPHVPGCYASVWLHL